MASFKRRTIVETDLYAECRAALRVDCKRLDDVLEGITMKMSVEPTYFPLAPGLADVRRARTQEFLPELPSFRIWFTFDSQKVVLGLLELTPLDDLPVPKQKPAWPKPRTGDFGGDAGTLGEDD